MPLRIPFARAYDRQELLRKHGLDPALPVVLVMGGGDGLIGRSLISMLEEAQEIPPAQFILVCGRNERLRLQLQKRLVRIAGPHRIRLTGFIDYVHELMAASDVMVTKPGGLTVSEALALDLPMILYKPIPGQEQENSAYLTGMGAALEARNKAELHQRICQVVSEEALRTVLRRNASLNKTVQGSSRTVLEIFKLLGQPLETGAHSSSPLDAHMLAVHA